MESPSPEPGDMDLHSDEEEVEELLPLTDRRPFEVVLRGGGPWGFCLEGGEGGENCSPLHVSEIEEESKAERSALLVGDIVLSVNGISCGGVHAAQQLIDSAFRTLTLRVLRGSREASSRTVGGARPQPHQQPQQPPPPSPARLNDPPASAARQRSGFSYTWRQTAHDDSAIYAKSKVSQKSAMRPSRPRRGDSFSVGKSSYPPHPSTGDPPWGRLSSGDRHSAHAAPRSAHLGVHDSQRSSVKSDRRYSDAHTRHLSRERERDQDRNRNREHPLVSAKSSPNVNKLEPPSAETKSSSVKSVKSSPNILDDVHRERAGDGRRISPHEQQTLSKPAAAAQFYGSSGYTTVKEARSGEHHQQKAKRYTEDMYTVDMKSLRESQCVTAHSLQKYHPDYENIALLATAPLKSEKVSEIDDIDDGADSGDAPAIFARPTYAADPNSPTPPERDPSSLKYIKVNQNHEKYPSWPVTQPNSAVDPSLPINSRAQSLTDHTNTSKEFPSKQRLAYQPGLQPLPERTPSTSEPRGDETGKPLRNSDPCFKTPVFEFDRFGKVVQKKRDDDVKGKFEDFYQNSVPGYLPPKFDSDGHSFGDEEYNVPSPPERDAVGVNRLALSQALGGEAGDRRQQKHPQQRLSQDAQQDNLRNIPGHCSSATSASTQSAGPQGGDARTSATICLSSNIPLQKQAGSLPTSSSQLVKESRRVDMATSPLSSPSNSLPSPQDSYFRASQSPFHRDHSPGDSAGVAASKASNKAVIVKQTPYYNTSTQTDMHSYSVKMVDSNAKQRNVEIQVDDVCGQTNPQIKVEEKSIQARMSREFQPSELDHSSPMKQQSGEKNYFNYNFQGMKSIQAKYGMDEDSAAASQPVEVFSTLGTGDEASIMRQLSEEFYIGGKMGLTDARHSPAASQEHSPKPGDYGCVYSDTGSMSQAGSYSSVVIHPSESVGPFGREYFGSQSSIADSRQELSSIASSSRSSLRDPVSGSRSGHEYFPRSAPRPLQESKKFNSLSSISHKHETSTPMMTRNLAQSQESLAQNQDAMGSRLRKPGRDSGSGSGSSSPSQPKSPQDSHPSAGYKYRNQGESMSNTSKSSHNTSIPASVHARAESVDSVFSERKPRHQRERSSGNDIGIGNSRDSALGRSAGKTAEMVGRKPSMKKAYGIYEDSDHPLPSPTRDTRGRGNYSDAGLLGQIQEEGDSGLSSNRRNQQTGELVHNKTQGDISDSHQRFDSWRVDLDMRTGRLQRAPSEQVYQNRDYPTRIYEHSSRPQRLFDGSIDSGVGSEISCRADSLNTPSESSKPGGFLPIDNPTGAELKKIQQQAVYNFIQRKTGKPSLLSSSAGHSPESSIYESVSTPRTPQSPNSDPVSDLISKTNENLAKRANSIRRTGSISSRASSSDYMDMHRTRKETEWSRLRSSGSFNYGSNRSSICSDNTYEDINVFAPATSRESTQGAPKHEQKQTKDSICPVEGSDVDAFGTNVDSGMMASTTYQNYPGAPRRRPPPPPPPRTPSPEPRTPPALPPRNYQRKEDGAVKPGGEGEGEGPVDETKINFKNIFNQWESSSPREDAYTAQLRKLDVKFSGLRGSSATAPTSMSVIHSRTQMAISTSYKRQPMVAQEATTPTSCVAGSTSTTSSVSSTSSLSGRASSPNIQSASGISSVAESHKSQPPPASLAKESLPPPATFIDRDTKPTAISSSNKPPQLPERAALPPREDKPGAPRTDNISLRGENQASRERNIAEVPNKPFERSLLSPPEVSRSGVPADARVAGKQDTGSASPVKDTSRSPAGKRRDVPAPPLPADDSLDGAVNPGDLPPPPPELLNDTGDHFVKGDRDKEKPEPFADDSYGAYRNSKTRQVGTYKRSSSAAVIRPDNSLIKTATDAQAVFSDRRLGNQNWNSDSQLQSGRRSDSQQGSSITAGASGPPGRPPDRAGNVPAFKADSGPARNVGRVSGVAQPLNSHSQPQGSPSRGRDDGKVFTARPFRVEQQRTVPDEETRNSNDVSPQQPRSVKSHIGHLERIITTSSSSAPTSPAHTAGAPSSTSQRWANATPFQTTHRAAGDSIKSQAGTSSSNNRVPNSRPVVLTDSQLPKERLPSGSSVVDPTQNSAGGRSRVYSERTQLQDMSPATDTKQKQRYAEVAPYASDSKTLPGHVRHSSQSSLEHSHQTSSPYNRRESAPVSQMPPEAAVAMVSPRRKSEGNFLSAHPEMEKDSTPPPLDIVISHGRQPSQEELECDLQAKELAREVADSEKKLSNVLNEDATKKRMNYMDGLFTGPMDVEVKMPASVRRHQSQGPGDISATKPKLLHTQSQPADEDSMNKRNSLPKGYFVSPPKAVIEMELRKKEESSTDLTKNIQDNDALIRQKEELIEKLYKKLDLLKEERKELQHEIEDNETLGRRVSDTVDTKCPNPSERDKFHTYISDLEKIVRLLLNLSGQLARAENAVQGLTEDADPKLKKMTLDKREKLQVKHTDAKQLKADIDKRSDNVIAFLRQSLSEEELNDYAYFIKMKSKLTIELQELEDKITLGQEQIQELKKSIPERTAPLVAELSSPACSPRSSPVPSS